MHRRSMGVRARALAARSRDTASRMYVLFPSTEPREIRRNGSRRAMSVRDEAATSAVRRRRSLAPLSFERRSFFYRESREALQRVRLSTARTIYRTRKKSRSSRRNSEQNCVLGLREINVGRKNYDIHAYYSRCIRVSDS